MDALATGTVAKLDEDQRLVFGWAYVAKRDGEQVVDHSGDFVDEEVWADYEKAAYDFVLVSREADEMHVKLEGVGKLVESVVLTPEKLEKMGLSGDQMGHWVGFKITDEEAWAKVKSGEYGMFSIRGSGVREDA